jgi:hypothetical protein
MKKLILMAVLGLGATQVHANSHKEDAHHKKHKGASKERQSQPYDTDSVDSKASAVQRKDDAQGTKKKEPPRQSRQGDHSIGRYE